MNPRRPCPSSTPSTGLLLLIVWSFWMGSAYASGPTEQSPRLAQLAPVGDSKHTVTVLMTGPRVGEIQNIIHLVESGLLTIPNLRLVGIYHADEYHDYGPSRRLIKSKATDLNWIQIKKISCRLSAHTIFKKNDCTKQYHALFKSSSAIIFTGGPDIPPSIYGKPTRLTTVIHDPPRHYFEISFMYHLLGNPRHPNHKAYLRTQPSYVVAGLCLGMQTMNVATGGTLIQDIPSELYAVSHMEAGLKLTSQRLHRSFHAPLNPNPQVGWAVIHPIQFIQKSAPTNLLPQSKLTVNVVSLHHQAVQKLGHGLKALATSPDGKVIEMVQHIRYPGVIGVQFHPEKKLIHQESFPYRKHPQAQIKNYVAHWYKNDLPAQEFLQNFWRLVGKNIQTSDEHKRELP